MFVIVMIASYNCFEEFSDSQIDTQIFTLPKDSGSFCTLSCMKIVIGKKNSVVKFCIPNVWEL